MGAVWLAARSLLADAAIFQRSALTRTEASWLAAAIWSAVCSTAAMKCAEYSCVRMRALRSRVDSGFSGLFNETSEQLVTVAISSANAATRSNASGVPTPPADAECSRHMLSPLPRLVDVHAKLSALATNSPIATAARPALVNRVSLREVNDPVSGALIWGVGRHFAPKTWCHRVAGLFAGHRRQS